MLAYCHLDPEEHTSVKFESKYKDFHSRNAYYIVVCKLVANTGYFVPASVC